MSWPAVALGELVDINIGRTPSRAQREYWGSGRPWLSIADMSQGTEICKTREQITDLAVRSCNMRVASVGTVLLSFKLSVGKVGIANMPLYTNEAIAALPIKSRIKLNNKYLSWALKTIDLTGGLDRAAMGLTLNKPKLAELAIPIPPLDEQQRIAAILDQADALRRRRREVSIKLRELIRASFVALFGDPIANPRGWPIQALGEVGELERGVSKHRPRNDPALLGGAYPLIQTGDIANADGTLATYSATYSEAGLKQSRLWPQGTLCITIAANIGKTAILTFDSCFPDSVVGFAPSSQVTVEYIQYWMTFIQKRLENDAPESAQKNINLAILRMLPVPVPPMETQDRFREIVNQIYVIKESAESNIKKLDNLFSALQYCIFSGKL